MLDLTLRNDVCQGHAIVTLVSIACNVIFCVCYLIEYQLVRSDYWLWRTTLFIFCNVPMSLSFLLFFIIQVQGQVSVLSGGVLIFGPSYYPFSEFELNAEELLMSDSTIKVNS